MTYSLHSVFLYIFVSIALIIPICKKPSQAKWSDLIDTSSPTTTITYGKKRGCFITGCATFLLICSLIGPYLAITKHDFSGLIPSVLLGSISIIVLLPSKYHGSLKLPTPILIKKIGWALFLFLLLSLTAPNILRALNTHEILAYAKSGSFIVNPEDDAFIFWYSYIANCGLLGFCIYTIRCFILSEYFPSKKL